MERQSQFIFSTYIDLMNYSINLLNIDTSLRADGLDQHYFDIRTNFGENAHHIATLEKAFEFLVPANFSCANNTEFGFNRSIEGFIDRINERDIYKDDLNLDEYQPNIVFLYFLMLHPLSRSRVQFLVAPKLLLNKELLTLSYMFSGATDSLLPQELDNKQINLGNEPETVRECKQKGVYLRQLVINHSKDNKFNSVDFIEFLGCFKDKIPELRAYLPDLIELIEGNLNYHKIGLDVNNFNDGHGNMPVPLLPQPA